MTVPEHQADGGQNSAGRFRQGGNSVGGSNTAMEAWNAQRWVNHGAELISTEPGVGQRLIGQGIRLEPEHGIAWFNLGLALHQRRRIPAAIRAYRQALSSANAPVVEASANLAQDLLLSGHFQEGWPLYEERFKRSSNSDFSTYHRQYGPAWQGFTDPRPCNTLVLVAEQGLGDTLQFCRLIPTLQERGINTSLFCPEPLAPLLRAGSAIGDITLMLGHQSDAVRWCPLLSLPHRLGLDWSTIPAADGYLKPEQARVASWAERLQRQPGKRLIALHWQGNPKFERKLYSQGRSMPFEAWRGLAGVPNLEFLSIQKGAGQEQLNTQAGLHFVAGQAAFDASFDFRDTAAALANCDLLLSADSSVVHLAGAMGLPTWVALSWVPEWRWGLEGTRTPWYASARLFRQPRRGDWGSVVAAMAEALRQLPPLS
jgi:hypothetical protein